MPAKEQRVAAVARKPGTLRAHEKYQRLADDCKTLPQTPPAVVHPCDQSSLQGAVDAARMGLIAPILVSSRTTGNPKLPSTVEAGALCKLADRGRITGAILDGPLALDNAISLKSVKIRQIESPVAARANVSVVPDLEAGNMLTKSLWFLAGADAAGMVLGARVPIVAHEPGRLAADASRVRCGGRADGEGSPRSVHESGGSSPSSSPPESARTARPGASGCAAMLAGQGSSSTRHPTQPAVCASAPGQAASRSG